MDISTAAVGTKPARNTAVDAAKGIGMLLIVLSHVNYTDGIQTYIYSFHVPLFFLLSGMLFRPEKYGSFGEFLRSRLRSLICPYVFFYLFSVAVKAATAVASGGMSGLASAGLGKAFFQMFLCNDGTYFLNNPLWFVLCLFWVEMVYYFIAKLKPWQNGTISVLLTVFGWLLKSELLPFGAVKVIWCLDLVPFVLGFFAVGCLLSGKVLPLLEGLNAAPRRKPLWLLAALVCFAAVAPLAAWNGKVSVGSGDYENGFLLFATALLGTAGALLAGTALSRCRFLRFLGKNTFAVMGTHYVLRNVYNAACSVAGLPIYDVNSIGQSVLPYIVILTASVLCAFLYGKLRPRLG